MKVKTQKGHLTQIQVEQWQQEDPSFSWSYGWIKLACSNRISVWPPTSASFQHVQHCVTYNTHVHVYGDLILARLPNIWWVITLSNQGPSLKVRSHNIYGERYIYVVNYGDNNEIFNTCGLMAHSPCHSPSCGSVQIMDWYCMSGTPGIQLCKINMYPHMSTT